METTTTEKRISKPFLFAGIFLLLSWMVFAAYIIIIMPDLIGNYEIGWKLLPMMIDLLVSLVIAIFALQVAFDLSKVKNLTIPLFLGGTLAIYSIINVIVLYGLGAANAFNIFRTTLTTLSYITFAIYAMKKNIAIVFASVITSVVYVFTLWSDIEVLIRAIGQDAGIQIVLGQILIILYTIGMILLVWSCCILLPPKSDKKPAKKNIAIQVLLCIVTLGVYSVFWIYSLSRDIAQLDKNPTNTALYTTLVFFVPFYVLFWLYKNGKASARVADDADMSWLFVVLGVFGFGLFAVSLMQYQVNMAISARE